MEEEEGGVCGAEGGRGGYFSEYRREGGKEREGPFHYDYTHYDHTHLQHAGIALRKILVVCSPQHVIFNKCLIDVTNQDSH